MLSGLSTWTARLRQTTWARRLAWTGLALAGLVLIVLVVATIAIYPSLPETSSLSSYRPKQPLRVLTADGVEIAGFGAERRVYLPIEQIPQLMQDSLLAVEDSRFYAHHGIDPIGVLRATLSNLTGRHMQGASTITQQVARTFFLSRSRTVGRKFKEALLALKIDSQLSKRQVLELYMNQIYLGERAYGFEAAAQVYFGKTLAALSPAECAMLAGLPKNPSFANPIRNLDRAKARQQLVLGRMHSQGVIDDAQLAVAQAAPMQIRKANAVDVHAEHVAEMVRQEVFTQFGELTYTTGLTVTTTLRAAEQEAAWRGVRRSLIERELRQTWSGPEGVEDVGEQSGDDDPALVQLLSDYDDDEDLPPAMVLRADPKHVSLLLASGQRLDITGAGLRQVQAALTPRAPEALRLRRGAVVRVWQAAKTDAKTGTSLGVITQWPQAEGALVALDPVLGHIRALVGGFDFHTNQFNHATQGWRQPGSSFKPFVYSAALENGVMPETLVNDAPMTGVGDWDPHNDDGSADGPTSVRQALIKSKNLVSIRLAQLLGPQAVRDWAAQFGFDPERQPDNLTLALGSGATTPMQLASAYAVIANGGFRIKPLLIKRIARTQGETIFEAPATLPLDEAQRAIPARNAFLTASLLRDVARVGTAAKAQATLKRTDLYGKTGTTNEVVDAWFAGFQPGLVAAVWMGYDQPKSLGSHASGSALALPAWIDFMAVALKGVPVQELVVPPGVVATAGDWRYAEFVNGGYIRTLGLEGEAIGPALLQRRAAEAASAGALAVPASPPPAQGER